MSHQMVTLSLATALLVGSIGAATAQTADLDSIEAMADRGDAVGARDGLDAWLAANESRVSRAELARYKTITCCRNTINTPATGTYHGSLPRDVLRRLSPF